MNLTPAALAIKAACPAFLQVGEAAEYDAAIDGVPTAPACFVVPMAEDVSECNRVDEWAQDVTVHFAVIIVVRHARNPQIGLEALRTAVRGTLQGQDIFVTEEDAHPVAWQGGQLLDLQPGLLWWQDRYSTTYTATAA